MQRAGFRFGFELGEDTRSGSRHARLRPMLLQPGEARGHVRVSGDDRGFQIVRSLPRQKGRHFESFRRACQRGFKDFLRGNRDLRREHEVPGGRQIDRRQPLADPFADRVAAVDEDRDVGAQPGPRFRATRCLRASNPTACSGPAARWPRPTSRRPARRRSADSSRARGRSLWPSRLSALSSLAARTQRLSSPKRPVEKQIWPSWRGAMPTRSQRSIRRKTVCSSW